MSVEQIQAQVLALYRGSPAAQSAANSFLISFINGSPEALNISLGLLLLPSSAFEVQFFAANTLYKVTQNKALLPSDLWDRLNDFLLQRDQPHHHLVLSRVCQTLAALALKTRSITRLLEQAFQLLGSNVDALAQTPAVNLLTGLCLLRSIAEEVERVDMSRAQREDIASTLERCFPQVVQVVEALVQRRRREFGRLGLETLEAWARNLEATSGGQEASSSLLTLPALAQEVGPGLWQSLLALVALNGVGEGEAEMVVAACQLLMRLIGMSSSSAEATGGRRRALAVHEQLYEAILAGIGQVMGEGRQQEESLVHAYGGFVIELATQEADQLVAQPQAGTSTMKSLEMIEILLALTNHENQHISSLSLEFWQALAEVPLAERDPRLGSALYARLVDVLVRRLAYPPHFTRWEVEVNLEQEDFQRYREGELMKELLESCYAFLRSQYFVQLTQQLETVVAASSTNWKVVEVVMLMMSQVSRPALAYLNSTQGAQEEDCLLTVRLILELLHKYLSVPNLAEAIHMLVLRALLRLLASYQVFLLPRAKRPLQGLVDEANARMLHRLALHCIVAQGLCCPDNDGDGVHQVAAVAFRSVCVGALPSGIIYTDPECLHLVLGTLQAVENQSDGTGKVDIGERLIVVEATVRTLLAVADLEQARSLLNQFTGPLLGNLETVLTQLLLMRGPGAEAAAVGGGVGAAMVHVAERLQLLGQVVRFVDVKGSGDAAAHVAQDLVARLWPLLKQTAAFAKGGGEEAGGGGGGGGVAVLVDQLFPLYRHLLVGLRGLMAAYLDALLSMVTQLYADTVHEGGLETVGLVVELFPQGKKGEAQRQEAQQREHVAFSQLFSGMCSCTFTYMRAGHPPQECPSLTAAFFDMSLRFLSFRPQVFFASPELPTLLELALACLESTEERDVTRNVLRLLRELLKTLQDRPYEPHVAPILQFLAAGNGQRFITRTLMALAGGAPLTVKANYFEFFYAFLQAWPVAAQVVDQQGDGRNGGHTYSSLLGTWVETAIFDANVLKEEKFSVTDRQLLVQVIGRLGVGGGRMKQKLKLLLDDVNKVASSEMDIQALQSYRVILQEVVDMT